MQIPTYLLFSVPFLLVACDVKETTVTVDETPNRVVEVNFSPVKEEGKGQRVQMEIMMELNTLSPAYPVGGLGPKAERLKLQAVEYEVWEDSYRGLFSFQPNEEVSKLSMADFMWTPYIEFDPITLTTTEGQINPE